MPLRSREETPSRTRILSALGWPSRGRWRGPARRPRRTRSQGPRCGSWIHTRRLPMVGIPSVRPHPRNRHPEQTRKSRRTRPLRHRPSHRMSPQTQTRGQQRPAASAAPQSPGWWLCLGDAGGLLTGWLTLQKPPDGEVAAPARSSRRSAPSAASGPAARCLSRAGSRPAASWTRIASRRSPPFAGPSASARTRWRRRGTRRCRGPSAGPGGFWAAWPDAARSPSSWAARPSCGSTPGAGSCSFASGSRRNQGSAKRPAAPSQ
mmetsp:Transcript_30636/g.90969  ORF Transcript_30636/g.90969 Transcript_30636/m.90969 type:complete len:263 (+) Transcript_30636:453-1241(+)